MPGAKAVPDGLVVTEPFPTVLIVSWQVLDMDVVPPPPPPPVLLQPTPVLMVTFMDAWVMMNVGMGFTCTVVVNVPPLKVAVMGTGFRFEIMTGPPELLQGIYESQSLSEDPRLLSDQARRRGIRRQIQKHFPDWSEVRQKPVFGLEGGCSIQLSYG